MIDLDRTQVEQCLEFDDAVRRVTEAYVKSSEGAVHTPEVIHLAFPDHNGDCHVKTGHIAGSDNFVIKVASGFYDNPQRGLPSSNGMMLVFSAETGAPIAILRDQGWLTDLRTGIGGALATQALASPHAERVLIIGTGIQARLQVQCLVDLDPSRAFRFEIWGRDQTKAHAVADELAGRGMDVTAANDLKDAVERCQIIVTTTPSRQALLETEWVQPGTHITAIGADSPGKQELPVSLVHRADVLVCDMKRQALTHGEFQHAASGNAHLRTVELGAVLAGQHPGRADADDITIADLTGIAAQDIAIAQSVVAVAQAKKDHI